MKKIVISFLRIGPYHLARLCNLQHAMNQMGWNLHIIEAKPDDDTYAWGHLNKKDLKNLYILKASSRTDTTSLIQAHLLSINPTHILIPGYSAKIALSQISWARKHNKPFYIMSDSAENDAKRIWFKELYKRFLIRGASGALVAGKIHEEYIQKLGINDNIQQGYDVVDNNYFSQASQIVLKSEQEIKQKYNLPKNYFLAIGRFIPKKQFSFLLDVYAALYSNNHDIYDLLIAGSGPEEQKLREKASTLKINHKVHFRPFQQYPDLPAYYALAKFTIVPSIFEQWGLVINESMACGTPVISTNTCGAVSELVDHNVSGFTFNPEDFQGLSKSILDAFQLSADTYTLMQTECLNIIQEWSLDRFSNSIISLISKKIETI